MLTRQSGLLHTELTVKGYGMVIYSKFWVWRLSQIFETPFDFELRLLAPFPLQRRGLHNFYTLSFQLKYGNPTVQIRSSLLTLALTAGFLNECLTSENICSVTSLGTFFPLPTKIQSCFHTRSLISKVHLMLKKKTVAFFILKSLLPRSKSSHLTTYRLCCCGKKDGNVCNRTNLVFELATFKGTLSTWMFDWKFCTSCSYNIKDQGRDFFQL